jgi:hypothetical protein
MLFLDDEMWLKGSCFREAQRSKNIDALISGEFSGLAISGPPGHYNWINIKDIFYYMTQQRLIIIVIIIIIIILRRRHLDALFLIYVFKGKISCSSVFDS